MHGKRLITAISISICAGLAGCVEPDDPGWEAFRDQAAREVDGRTIYIVEWDLALTLDELRAYYDEHVAPGGLGTIRQSSTVSQVNGVDDVWPSAIAQHLTYCVSNDFGFNKSRAIDEMNQATRAWEAEAHVNFDYQPANDSNCSNTTSPTTFSVRPWTDGGACAFSPSGGGCVPRTLVIDYDSYDVVAGAGSAPNKRTIGVFRHELGHILGLRHEHIRAPGSPCAEDGGSRNVTAYDQASVMHYPSCGGIATSDYSITNLDADGIRQLYGPSFSPRGPSFVAADFDGNPGLDILQYWRRWGSIPTCRWSPGSGFSCAVTPAAVADALDGTQQILTGDFNGDQHIDLVQAHRKWSVLPTCLNNLTGGWQCSNPSAPIVQHADDTDELRFLTGKFDTNTGDDVIQVYRRLPFIPVCHRTPGGVWSCISSPADIYDWGSAEQQFLLGDVDGTGHPSTTFTDVIQTFRRWGSIPVCRASGNGAWSCTNPPAEIYDSGSHEQRFHAGDLDADGKVDVIQTFRGWGSIPICRADGDPGQFTGWDCDNVSADVYNSGSFEQQFLTGDFNGDGRTDVVQTFRGWGSIPLCTSTGAPGEFTGWDCDNVPAEIHDSGSREQRFIAADVDADGKTDVIQVYRGWSSYPVCFARSGPSWDCKNLPATLFNVDETAGSFHGHGKVFGGNIFSETFVYTTPDTCSPGYQRLGTPITRWFSNLGGNCQFIAWLTTDPTDCRATIQATTSGGGFGGTCYTQTQQAVRQPL